MEKKKNNKKTKKTSLRLKNIADGLSWIRDGSQSAYGLCFLPE